MGNSGYFRKFPDHILGASHEIIMSENHFEFYDGHEEQILIGKTDFKPLLSHEYHFVEPPEASVLGEFMKFNGCTRVSQGVSGALEVSWNSTCTFRGD